jgi:putative exporter of polyketide antibiotics
MRRDPIPFIIWFAVAAFVTVFGSLAWIAISEKAISTGTRTGISHKEGLSALVAGFFYLGVAVAALGVLAYRNRFKRLIWLALAVIWLLSVAGYFVTSC